MRRFPAANGPFLIALLTSGIGAFALYASYLFATPELQGSDAYVYIIQVRSLIETGRLHYRDLSPVYPFMAAFRLCLSSDISAYKVSLALIGALRVMALYFAVFSLFSKNSFAQNGRNTRGDSNTGGQFEALACAAAAVFFLLASPTQLYVLLQFPKNSLALAAMMTTLAFVLRGTPAAALFFFLLTAITHRIGAGMLLASAAFLLLLSLRIKTLFALAIPFLSVICLATLCMPGMLNLFDLERITTTLRTQASYAPLHFAETIGIQGNDPLWLVEIHGIIPLIIAIALYYSGKYALASASLPQQKTSTKNEPILGAAVRSSIRELFASREKILGAFFCADMLLLFPFFDYTADGIGLRFFLQSSAAAPLALTLLLYTFFRHPFNRRLYPPMTGQMHNHITSFAFRYCLAPALFFLCSVTLFFAAGRSYLSKQIDPPYALYRQVSAKVATLVSPAEVDLFVAHKSLAETMDYELRADVLPWSPEARFDRKRTWRIAWMISPWQIRSITGESEAIFELSPSYTLLREDVWERFLDAVIDDPFYEGIIDHWKNPSRVRPAYLSKQK